MTLKLLPEEKALSKQEKIALRQAIQAFYTNRFGVNVGRRFGLRAFKRGWLEGGKLNKDCPYQVQANTKSFDAAYRNYWLSGQQFYQSAQSAQQAAQQVAPVIAFNLSGSNSNTQSLPKSSYGFNAHQIQIKSYASFVVGAQPSPAKSVYAVSASLDKKSMLRSTINHMKSYLFADTLESKVSAIQTAITYGFKDKSNSFDELLGFAREYLANHIQELEAKLALM